MNIPNHTTLEAHNAWRSRNAGMIDLDAYDFGGATLEDLERYEDERRAALTQVERDAEDADLADWGAAEAAAAAAASEDPSNPF